MTVYVDDVSGLLAAFKAAQNVTQVRAHRARPKKRKRKAERNDDDLA